MMRTRARREEIYSAAEYWDSKADTHADSAVSMWANRSLNAHYQKEQEAWLLDQLPNVTGLRVLDLGCGTGRLSRFLANRGAQVVGVDFAARAIEIARRQSSGDNPIYRVQSAFELDERAAFDVVLTWGSLTVACRDGAQLLDVLARIWRSLAPGGRVLLLEPIHRGFLHRVLNINLRQFKAAMATAGFLVQGVTHLHFWPARLVLAYVPWPKFITTPIYYLGQGILALLGRKGMGDYQGIVATPHDD